MTQRNLDSFLIAMLVFTPKPYAQGAIAAFEQPLFSRTTHFLNATLPRFPEG